MQSWRRIRVQSGNRIEDEAPDPDDPESGTDVKAGEDGSPDDPDAAVIAGEATNLTAIKLYFYCILFFAN